jgi:putative transposase
MKARYRYRIYPTPSQKVSLAKLFGCTRVVWNDALAYCIEQYHAGNKKPKNGDLQKTFITEAKKTTERQWLKEVSNIPLQQSLNDLEQAYQNFFKSCQGERKGQPVKPPKFKKRRHKQSARFRKGGFKVNERTVFLAKIGKLKIVWSRPLPCEPSSVTVIKDSAGRYFLSFVVEVENEPMKPNDQSVGVDLGISTFATLSTGEKVDSPKPLKREIKRLRKLDKQLSKKTKGSNRYERARKKRAKLYAKLADTRTDFLHKLSTRLICENQTIVLEDLNVSGMVKNRKLSLSN